MIPHVDRRTLEVARAAAVLEAGERLAHRVAARQAGIAREPKAARFLGVQARQEAFHARVFASAARLLAPKVTVANPAQAALAALASRLDSDLDAGELWPSVVGLQVALEALGQAVLDELEGVVAQHVPALAPLHSLLARQEAAHRAFGTRCVARAIECGELTPARLRGATRDYDALVGELLMACAEVLDGLGVPYERYAERFEAALPRWFRVAASA